MKRQLYFIICFCFSSFFILFGQSTDFDASNIVSNPSFERFSATPIGWFKKGEHYTRVMKYWESPTAASPDIFGPRIRVPKYWTDKGFGMQPPHSGQAMSGLTTYGCEGKKTHCREYISIQLNEPLVPGQTYLVEFYVSHLQGAYFSNNLGLYFSKEKIKRETDEILEYKPQFRMAEVLEIPNNKWKKITGQIVAETEAEYLTIGNFDTDDNSLYKEDRNNRIAYAYYYLDDILVKKLPPYLPVPLKEDDLTFEKLEEGKLIQLKDIYFDFDSADLHPRSFVELRKLVKILNENPSVKIKIIGHTDSVGEDRYNKYLSRKRAKAVVLYLMEESIAPSRLDYLGEGEAKPVASNETDAGRQMNRRVEIKIESGLPSSVSQRK